MITVKAPGKLYIVGEYAVLEHGHPAIIVALDQYITATIKQTTKQGTITSSYSQNKPITWTRFQGQATLTKFNSAFRYVITAINMAELYINALGKKLRFFDLTLTSSLDNKNGTKYGFGSSGAVTVATIKAVLQFYNIQATHDLIYKLAVFTQLKLQENGSFGDIAASTYGGWIAYSTFDRSWLLNKIEEVPFTELIHTQWSNLRIEPLPAPNLKLLIGWTGTPASTTDLVDQVKEDLHNHTFSELQYDEFLDYAKDTVETMIKAFYRQNHQAICQGITKYRNLLLAFSKMTNIQIETPTLKKLTDLANQLNIVAKSSGAGGGDCGIALTPSSNKSQQLIKLWQENGITPLTNINVYFEKGSTYEQKS